MNFLYHQSPFRIQSQCKKKVVTFFVTFPPLHLFWLAQVFWPRVGYFVSESIVIAFTKLSEGMNSVVCYSCLEKLVCGQGSLGSAQ